MKIGNTNNGNKGISLAHLQIKTKPIAKLIKATIQTIQFGLYLLQPLLLVFSYIIIEARHRNRRLILQVPTAVIINKVPIVQLVLIHQKIQVPIQEHIRQKYVLCATVQAYLNICQAT